MGQFGTHFRLKFPQCLITKGAFCSLMNGKSTLALVGVLFAAAMVVGMATTSAFSTPHVIASSTIVDNQFGMLGHITLTQTDADGNMKSYIQTDNVIVNIGENCVAETLFNVTADTGPDGCDGASTPLYTKSGNGINNLGFSFIAVGNSSASATPPVAVETDTTLINENSTGTTMDRKTGSPTVTTESTGVGSSAVVTLSAVFTSDGGISDVDESGIFDEPTFGAPGPGNMLARQTFTNIQLSDGDQLTVEWEITIGS
ncbi:MAG: hypothetical protein NPMRD1_270017 [Nitrosopumilales archaeon]|nr:MAG: hypothetical protein NPMRD1_270017 [Nitrosopumilales archaeon]